MNNTVRKTRILLIIFVFIISILTAIFFLINKEQNSPQKQLDKAIQEYKTINFHTAIPGKGVDTLESVRNILTNQATNAEKYLSIGDKEKAKNELIMLKKNIEGQSKADKEYAKVSQGKIPDIDRNGNGINDYLEPFYKTTVSIINQLQ